MRAACRKNPSSVESMRTLAANQKLLNWRCPVDGQTLLHELVVAGASESVIQQAVDLGCDPSMPNSRGKTPQELGDQKQVADPGQLRLGRASEWGAFPRGLESNRRVSRATASELPTSQRVPAQTQQMWTPGASLLDPGPAPVLGSKRRKGGFSLAKNETTSMPKAKINLDVDLCEEGDLDEAKLQAAVQKTYGGTARVQIDEVADKECAGPRSAGPSKRVQAVKCRVMFGSAEEAFGWQERSRSSREVQENIATNFGVRGEAVQFETPVIMQEVDAVTLKLDSDSSHILCGACLLYDAHGKCEKVVHYSDRLYDGGVVRHSGDTQVDGKSVHTISIVQSKIPAHVTSMYFTLCSCGPSDLSGFPNPSIMLYDHSEPDANLLEYSIEQAGHSPSCVIARLSRRPKRSNDQRISVACALRRKGLSFLCVDIVLALAAETSWDVKALGTEEWHLASKICCNYDSCKSMIEQKVRQEREP